MSHEEKTKTTAKEASKILESTPYMKGFHFYAAVDHYTEETASNLFEFSKALETIPERSIIFHSQRKDFQKWISQTIGDTQLAERIDKIESTLPAEEIRKRLVTTIRVRIAELEKISSK